MKVMGTYSKKSEDLTLFSNRENLKEQIQNKAVNLSETYPVLILEHATGVGKSLSAIKIIEKHGGRWTIMVAETNHINNWMLEFQKHGKVDLLNNVTFACYASWHKHTQCDNYILDECHNTLNSALRLEYLKTIAGNAKRVIGLTATLNKNQRNNLREIFHNAYFYKIPLDSAIEHGILPEPKIYLVSVKLNNTEKYIPFKIDKNKTIICSEEEWYTRQTNLIEKRKKEFFTSNEEWRKYRWLQEASKRKNMLADVKTKFVAKFLEKVGDKKLICFTQSIKQSEELSKGMSIHSKISEDTREELIKEFNSGKIKRIFTTRMLRESMNLEGIELGIMVQLDNNQKSFYQTTGRVLRARFPEYYLFYVEDTQDEVYVRNALENFNKELLTYITFENLMNKEN